MRFHEHAPAMHPLTEDEVRAIYDNARRLRAEAFRDHAVRIGGAVGTGLRRCMTAMGAVLHAFAEARAARQTYLALSRLSDGELNDIGLTRGDIPAVAWGQWPRADASQRAEDRAVAETPAEARDAADEAEREAGQEYRLAA